MDAHTLLSSSAHVKQGMVVLFFGEKIICAGSFTYQRFGTDSGNTWVSHGKYSTLGSMHMFTRTRGFYSVNSLHTLPVIDNIFLYNTLIPDPLTG